MKMKRTRLMIIGASTFMVLAGCQGFSRSSYDEKEYISEKAIKVLEIEDKNIPVTITGVDESQPVTITYYENKNETYSIDEQKDKLVIKKNAQKNGWSIFSWLNFSFGKGAEVTVEIPSSLLSSLDVKTSNSRISVENMSIDEAKLESSNGGIYLEDIQAAQKIEGKTSNSMIELNDIDAEELEFKTSNGKIDLSELSFSDGRFETSNGKISFDELSVKNYLSIKSSNGQINGTIAGKQSDFSIDSKTSNGKNNLSNTTSGKKELVVKTSNGKIKIDFSRD